MKPNIKNLLIFAALILVTVTVVVTVISRSAGTRKKIDNFSEVVEKFENNQVAEFKIQKDNTLIIKDTSSVEYTYTLRDISIFRERLGEVIDRNAAEGTLKVYDYEPIPSIPIFVTWIPSIVMVILVIVGYF